MFSVYGFAQTCSVVVLSVVWYVVQEVKGNTGSFLGVYFLEFLQCNIGSIQYKINVIWATVLLLSICSLRCSHRLTVGAMGALFIPGSVFPFQHGPQPRNGKTTWLHRIPTSPRGFHSHRDRFLPQIVPVVWSPPVALYSPTSHLSQSLLILLVHSFFSPLYPVASGFWPNVRNRSQAHHWASLSSTHCPLCPVTQPVLLSPR